MLRLVSIFTLLYYKNWINNMKTNASSLAIIIKFMERKRKIKMLTDITK